MIILLFVGIFSLLSLFTFYNEILHQVRLLTFQLITASFAIIGSTILVMFTIIIQVRRNFFPSDSVRNSISRNKALLLLDTQKRIRASAEAVSNKQIIQERERKNQYEDFGALSLTQSIGHTNIFKDYIQQKKASQKISSINSAQIIQNDLIKLQGIRIEHVTLLKEMNIYTVYDLSIQDPDDLFHKIRNRNRPHEKDKDWIPSKEMIRRWIRISKQFVENI